MNVFVTNIVRRFRVSLLLVSSLSFSVSVYSAQPNFIIIGTAGSTGVYHPAGNAICRIVNNERKEDQKYGIHCSTLGSSGSVDNISNLISGEVDLAIVQSDVLHDSAEGLNNLSKIQNLRVIMALHEEQFTVIVHAKSKIINLNGVLGKRVNIGPRESGQYHTMQAIMRVKNWSDSDFKSLTDLSIAEQATQLCSNNIDVLIFSSGHPSGVLKQIISNCDVRLLNIEDQEIEQLINDNKAYKKATIAAGTYKNNTQDINTFSVQALLVATEQVDNDITQHIIENVTDNLSSFKAMHPALKSLDKTSLLFNDAYSNKPISK